MCDLDPVHDGVKQEEEEMASRAAALLNAFRGGVTRPSSRSAEEAKHRVFELFRQACRSLPAIMNIYNLHDVITLEELRSKVADEFRKHENLRNPKTIDMLVFKGREELENCATHAKQRHHLISQYVVGREGMVQPNKLGIFDLGESEFLKKFYRSNID